MNTSSLCIISVPRLVTGKYYHWLVSEKTNVERPVRQVVYINHQLAGKISIPLLLLNNCFSVELPSAVKSIVTNGQLQALRNPQQTNHTFLLANSLIQSGLHHWAATKRIQNKHLFLRTTRILVECSHTSRLGGDSLGRLHTDMAPDLTASLWDSYIAICSSRTDMSFCLLAAASSAFLRMIWGNCWPGFIWRYL